MAKNDISRWLYQEARDGHGQFMLGEQLFETDFSITRLPQSVVVKVSGQDASELAFLIPMSKSNVELSGTLLNGVTIHATLLHYRSTCSLPNQNDSYISLLADGDVTLGTQSSAKLESVQYPLIGYYEGIFEIEIDGWTISTQPASMDIESATELYIGWHYRPEGIVLRVEHVNATIDQYNSIADDICDLLSLATGAFITYSRQINTYDDGNQCEIWKQKASRCPGAQCCIPSFRIQQFLEETIIRYGKLDNQQKQMFRLMCMMIALSGLGNTETRMVQIFQAWEVVSFNYNPTDPNASKIDALKRRLQMEFNVLVNSIKIPDPNGVLWGRISKSIDWKTVLSKINTYLESHPIITTKIGLDFAELKKARDYITHTGALPGDFSSDWNRAYDLLRAARFGLQLSLLIDIGYTGLVEWEVDGWKDFSRICDFLVMS